MSRKTLKNKIESIRRESLFNKQYAQGIRKLHQLEVKGVSRNLLLCTYGILYDHLAIFSRSQKKKNLEQTARSYYKEAIKQGVGGLNPYWGLGRILMHNKKYAAGLRYYSKVYDLRPGSRSARRAYAVALSWTGQMKKAKRLFIIDRRKYGPSFQMSFNMVNIEKTLGNQAKSRMYAKEALRFWQRNRSRRTLFGKAWEEYLKSVIHDA